MSSGFQYAGAVGAVYDLAYIQARTISFHDENPDEIHDSDNGFVNAGFADEDEIAVVGSAEENDGDYTIDGVVLAGTITLDAGDILANEDAGALVTIYKTDIGEQIGGVTNFVVTEEVTKLETSNFDNADPITLENWEESQPGMYRWSATAEKLWSTDTTNVYALSGKLRMFRFYDADVYREGVGWIQGPGTVSDVNDLVRNSVTIVGVGPLTPHAVV